MCSRAGPEVGEAAVTGDRRARDRTMESGIWNPEVRVGAKAKRRKRGEESATAPLAGCSLELPSLGCAWVSGVGR